MKDSSYGLVADRVTEADISYGQSILNKKPNPFNNSESNETKVEYKALCHEVELSRRETTIAFKRLVAIELRVEAIENKLRGLKSKE